MLRSAQHAWQPNICREKKEGFPTRSRIQTKDAINQNLFLAATHHQSRFMATRGPIPAAAPPGSASSRLEAPDAGLGRMTANGSRDSITFLANFFPFPWCGPPYTQTFSIAVQLSRSMRILVLAYVSCSSCAIVETYLTHRLARLVRTPWHLGQLEEIFTSYWDTRMPNYCRTYLSHPENNHLEESVNASP